MKGTGMKEKAKGKRGLSSVFWALIGAQIISLFGNAVLRFALPLYVLNVTGSSTVMGAVIACSWVPYIVLAPIGGVAADRVPKRFVMAVLDGVMALVCVSYLFALQALNVVVLSAFSLMVLYAVQSVYQPTVQASVPSIVSHEAIQKATALVSQVSMLSSIIGPVIGGLVFGFAGIELVVAISGVLFVFSATLILAFVRIPFSPLPRRGTIAATVLGDLSEAFLFLRKDRPVIFRTILLATAFNLVMSSFITIGTPVVITEVLGLSNQYLGFAEGILALGGLVGGIAAATLTTKLDLRRSPLVLFIGSVALLLLGAGCLLTNVGVAYGVIVVGLFITMACCSLFSILAIAFVQGETPKHLIGKVMAFVMCLSNCASPIGQVLYGVLLDVFRSSLPLVVLCVVVISCVLALVVRKVLQDGLGSSLDKES